MSDTTMDNLDARRLVDQNLLAHVLRTSPGAVVTMVKRGEIPAYRVGARGLRFDLDECLRHLRIEGPAAERRGGAA